MSKRTGYFVAILACVLLASCKSAGPVKTFVKGDEINYYDFNTSKQFEQGTYSTASLLVRDGVYRIDVRSGDDELWWGQGGPTLSDVVIDVDALQLSQRNENAYGIMCRVRGHIGQQVIAPDATAEATASATSVATVEATTAATAEATANATGAATQASTAEATTNASVAAQGLAQMMAMAGATGEATGEATGSATQAAAGTAESTVAANPLAQELAAIPDAATAETTAQATAAATAPATTLEDNNGDGYLFLIQGTGSFAIFRSRGRSLTPLVNWTTSDKIKVGPDSNHLRAVCIGTYLAFYANDAFLGDATDDAYTEGQVGLAASAANRLGVRIDYDNLSISAAKPG